MFNKNQPPGKAYVRLQKMPRETYCKEYEDEVIGSAKDYLRDMLKEHHAELKEYDFWLAALWRKIYRGKDEGIISLFCFQGIRPWPGNPNVSAQVLVDGVYKPSYNSITCGDTLVLIGLEERFRRSTSSLESYMDWHHHPKSEKSEKSHWYYLIDE